MQALLLLSVLRALNFVSSDGLINDGPVKLPASDVLRVRSILLCVCFSEKLHLRTDLSLSHVEFCSLVPMG